MIQTISVDNVNEALPCGMSMLDEVGEYEESRNGPVLVAPGPVLTEYARPWNRVIFSQLRDANPFFHLVESLWMLAGRNDLALPQAYVKQFAAFSDDGKTLNGAYGYRWRAHFAFDQLYHAVAQLYKDNSTRRVVLSMWDGWSDLTNTKSKDLPCNTHCYFMVRDKKLTMTVCNRSNDMIWGAYGANAVHFSVLQEYVACAIGLSCGPMYQLSNNYHVYCDRPDVAKLWKELPSYAGERIGHVLCEDRYYTNEAVALPLFQAPEEAGMFLRQCGQLLAGELGRVTLPFLKQTAIPMILAHATYTSGDKKLALETCENILATDWRLACQQWIQRRLNKEEA